MIIYNTVENIAIEKIHSTFIDAFSDYQVKMDLPLLKLQQMLKRRGYVAAASIGAFNDDAFLVGFLLNAIRPWNGKLSAYDTGTGVINSYRNNGITSNMFLSAKELIKEMGVEQYVLEVIQSNTPAVSLYKKQGFEILRDFECFILDKNRFKAMPKYKVQNIKIITESIWLELIKFWDFMPSWQNSIDSINAAADTFKYSIVSIEGTIVGYGIIDIITGDIPQIAVDKNHRGNGIGKSIFTDLLKSTEADSIKVLNVDSKSTAMKNFLLKLGFDQNVKQYEMSLKL
ncbi:GNAT family N-acetyltransferase [Clostridium saccharoperbutylacetonicum]|uniref:GNAT family N-acetyltransferase n=1 Tax=Clostridium saccharoperbutylacetonicum TaxID=36745 RepID=UPI000983D80E|nr:GNAT family N-acetyltransferase [Clostridium saccharoperbutylacetonicum]AQR94508.1 ribosomal-protein-alanine N-acetyltransferase [Clostridium saccharoperbutylacetonicum]NSB30343.1 ribosomal protein S18 acetylase RimI-like enzyme [Clostridium saccharoperbutylacetonicum]